jgi:hypothetical protein
MIFDKLLLIFYALAVFLSRGKKDVVNRATSFFLGSFLFFNTISLLLFLLPKFNFRINKIGLAIILIVVGYFTQVGTEKWIYKKLRSEKTYNQYESLKYKKLCVLLGFLLLIVSLYGILLVGIFNFVGYILN